ncbi:carboxypeptidase B-like [Oratosquilla oratoria]|uniref:carboxypeptidase B-like n=1 Tax=Oratosquilla oratoria TaxID=337810 RepID=UPI003F76A724
MHSFSMKALAFLSCLALAGLVGAATSPSSHQDLVGAQVLRVTPKSLDDLHRLHGLMMEDLYDFWTEPRAVGRNVDVMALRGRVETLKTTLDSLDLEYSVHVKDLAALTLDSLAINDRALRMARAKTSGAKHNMEWTSYHRLSDIYDYMEYLANNYGHVATVEFVGKSYEGQDMKMLRLSTGGSNKPAVFVDGGIHAREWISPATVAYMMGKLVEESANYDFLKKVDFYFMPSINPDGYEYSHKASYTRHWRKTRSDTDNTLGCKGVDGNRNWDFHWNEVGSSSQPCSDMFAGDRGFSEVEMRNVRDQINKHKDTIKVYLTFHSFSQMWLYPWGYTSGLPDDWKDLHHLADEASTALYNVHGTSYEVGSSATTIYPAAGGSDDWAKAVAGVKYAYTVELRDTGEYGFLLPPSQIIPTCEETFEALKTVGNFVAKTYQE